MYFHGHGYKLILTNIEQLVILSLSDWLYNSLMKEDVVRQA